MGQGVCRRDGGAVRDVHLPGAEVQALDQHNWLLPTTATENTPHYGHTTRIILRPLRYYVVVLLVRVPPWTSLDSLGSLRFAFSHSLHKMAELMQKVGFKEAKKRRRTRKQKVKSCRRHMRYASRKYAWPERVPFQSPARTLYRSSCQVVCREWRYFLVLFSFRAAFFLLPYRFGPLLVFCQYPFFTSFLDHHFFSVFQPLSL